MNKKKSNERSEIPEDILKYVRSLIKKHDPQGSEKITILLLSSVSFLFKTLCDTVGLKKFIEITSSKDLHTVSEYALDFIKVYNKEMDKI